MSDLWLKMSNGVWFQTQMTHFYCSSVSWTFRWVQQNRKSCHYGVRIINMQKRKYITYNDGHFCRCYPIYLISQVNNSCLWTFVLDLRLFFLLIYSFVCLLFPFEEVAVVQIRKKARKSSNHLILIMCCITSDMCCIIVRPDTQQLYNIKGN